MIFDAIRFDASKDTGTGAPSGADNPTAGVTSDVTPTPTTPDAIAESQALKEQGDKLAQLQRDINNIKSVYDRKLAEQQRKHEEETLKLRRQLTQTQIDALPDAEKLKYEKTLQEEQTRELQQRYEETQRQLEGFQVMESYREFFESLGVPKANLQRTSPEELLQSGWDGVRELVQNQSAEIARLKAGTSSNEQAPAEPKPKINTTNPTNPPGQPKIEDLIKKYANGDEEQFWELIEQGKISASIIPSE